MNLERLLRRLTPFWLPFDSIWVDWCYFGSILNCLRSIFAIFCFLLVSKSLKQIFETLSANHLETIPGSLTFVHHRPYGSEFEIKIES